MCTSSALCVTLSFVSTVGRINYVQQVPSPRQHYHQCHNALIYSKYKAKSLHYEIYILVTHIYYVINYFVKLNPKYGIYLPNVRLYQDCERYVSLNYI